MSNSRETHNASKGTISCVMESRLFTPMTRPVFIIPNANGPKRIACHEGPSTKWKISRWKLIRSGTRSLGGPAAHWTAEVETWRPTKNVLKNQWLLYVWTYFGLIGVEIKIRNLPLYGKSVSFSHGHGGMKVRGKKHYTLKPSSVKLWCWVDRPTNTFTSQWFTVWVDKNSIFTSTLSLLHKPWFRPFYDSQKSLRPFILVWLHVLLLWTLLFSWICCQQVKWRQL